MTNHHNDINADDQFIMHDAIEDLILDGASDEENPVWIENEDGTGQWSDGWDGDDEIILPSPNDHHFWEHTHNDDEEEAVSTLRLFVIHLSTKDWSSEYGCMFVVRAEDEDAARTIIDEDAADYYRKGYDLHITEIGFTDATDPAIVSSMRT